MIVLPPVSPPLVRADDQGSISSFLTAWQSVCNYKNCQAGARATGTQVKGHPHGFVNIDFFKTKILKIECKRYLK